MRGRRGRRLSSNFDPLPGGRAVARQRRRPKPTEDPVTAERMALADARAKPAIREQVNIRSLFSEQGRLSLRQDDHAGDQFRVW